MFVYYNFTFCLWSRDVTFVNLLIEYSLLLSSATHVLVWEYIIVYIYNTETQKRSYFTFCCLLFNWCISIFLNAIHAVKANKTRMALRSQRHMLAMQIWKIGFWDNHSFFFFFHSCNELFLTLTINELTNTDSCYSYY